MRVCFDNVDFAFGERKILHNFSLNLHFDDSPVVILGPSGCGKTTFLRLAAGLLSPSSGTVTRDCGVSFAFQEPRLLPNLSAFDNTALPVRKIPGGKERALRFLKLCGLGERLNSFPDELSGGQKQRVSLARAWAYPAPLILLDEPFQGLEEDLRERLIDAILALLAEENRFLLAVTHDEFCAQRLAKRVVRFGNARKQASRPP